MSTTDTTNDGEIAYVAVHASSMTSLQDSKGLYGHGAFVDYIEQHAQQNGASIHEIYAKESDAPGSYMITFTVLAVSADKGQALKDAITGAANAFKPRMRTLEILGPRPDPFTVRAKSYGYLRPTLNPQIRQLRPKL
jgi:hypothetical protein